MAICLERCADLHMAQLMPLPVTVSCFSKIQIGFYLSGTGSPTVDARFTETQTLMSSKATSREGSSVHDASSSEDGASDASRCLTTVSRLETARWVTNGIATTAAVWNSV